MEEGGGYGSCGLSEPCFWYLVAVEGLEKVSGGSD